MKFDPNQHHRRSIRLPGYDYSQPGAYFITICTHKRQEIFGEIIHGEMHLNRAGRIAEQEWRRLPQHFPNIELGAFVVMPNHIHAILIIRPPADRTGSTLDSQTARSEGGGVNPDDEPVVRGGSPRTRGADIVGATRAERPRAAGIEEGSPRTRGADIVGATRAERPGAAGIEEGSPQTRGEVMATLDSQTARSEGGGVNPDDEPDVRGGSPRTRGADIVGATRAERPGAAGIEEGSPRTRGADIVGATRAERPGAAGIEKGSPQTRGADIVGATRAERPGAAGIEEGSPQRSDGPAPGSVGAMIGQFKSRLTRRLWAKQPGRRGAPVWQRNYYEHIIRDEQAYHNIHAYIEANPLLWTEDQLHPDAADQESR